MDYSKRQKAIILYLSNRQKLSAMEVPGKQIADHLQISLRTLQNEIKIINNSVNGTLVASSNRTKKLFPVFICRLNFRMMMKYRF